MQLDLMKKAVIASVIFFLVGMGSILYLSAGKIVTISDVAQDEVQRGKSAADRSGEGNAQSLTFAQGESNTSYLCIPLPHESKAEDIVIENHYMDQELCVLVGNAERDFYRNHPISGNRDMIQAGSCETIKDGVKLRFQLTGIFEYRTILENNDLYISFLSPREMYDKIVVIDPACGGTDAGYEANGLQEKEITLQIARKLKEKLDGTDIKAYYTRMDDDNPEEAARIELANETRADMYIRIQVDADEDSSVYGTTTVYNGDYFIPGFGSVELADLLERQVVTSIKGKAIGLAEADAAETVLRHITIPAAAIKVGCITNKQEAILLGREEYCDRIAEGIYQAICSAYEE